MGWGGALLKEKGEKWDASLIVRMVLGGRGHLGAECDVKKDEVGAPPDVPTWM